MKNFKKKISSSILLFSIGATVLPSAIISSNQIAKNVSNGKHNMSLNNGNDFSKMLDNSLKKTSDNIVINDKFSDTKELLNSMFPNGNSIVLSSDEVSLTKNNLNNEVINFIKEESNKYLDKIYNHNFLFSDIMNIASKKGFTYEQLEKEIDSNYDSSKIINNKDQNHNLVPNVSQYSNISYMSENIEKVSYLLKQIQNAGIKSGIIAGAASALAAAYWAASWFFGLTISSAIAATTQAAMFAAQGAIYGTFYELNKNKPEYVDIKDIDAFDVSGKISWISSAIFAAYDVKDWIKTIYNSIKTIRTITTTLRTVVFSTSWAVPASLIFLTIGDVVISIADLVINFPF